MGKRKVKRWICYFCIWALPAILQAQTTDSFNKEDYLTRAMMYGVGYSNIYDTYLSPQEYKGMEFRISRETMRLGKKNISYQNFLQANASYTHNHVDNNNTFAGFVNWNYGLLYNFPVTQNFKILAGGLVDTNFGIIYNLRNSNNPASVRAYINLGASGMFVWDVRVWNTPLTLRYQANLPLAGIYFSPNYGQSYYEIFSLGNFSGVFKLTSLNKQPSLRQMFSVDIPVNYSKLRFTYMWDMQQSKVNNLSTHTYGHVFMVGFVKEFYRIKRKYK